MVEGYGEEWVGLVVEQVTPRGYGSMVERACSNEICDWIFVDVIRKIDTVVCAIIVMLE
jgi:hypothetical protein